jgi:hypothetical protein
VQRLECEDFEDQEIERPLDEIGWFAHASAPPSVTE